MNAGNTVIKPPVSLPLVRALHQRYEQKYTRLAIFAEGGEQNVQAANHSVSFARQAVWNVLGMRRGIGRKLKLRTRNREKQSNAKKDRSLVGKITWRYNRPMSTNTCKHNYARKFVTSHLESLTPLKRNPTCINLP